MREFLFRVWDSDTKIMSKPFSFKDLYGHSSGGSNMVGISDLASPEGIMFVRHSVLSIPDGVDPYLKIMQSTGLKDKNGKMIFEGDILQERNISYTFKYLVLFDRGAFILKSYALPEYPLLHCHGRCEIIGNQFENHELLEDVRR